MKKKTRIHLKTFLRAISNEIFKTLINYLWLGFISKQNNIIIWMYAINQNNLTGVFIYTATENVNCFFAD